MIAIVNFSLRNYSDDSFVCMIKSLNIGFNESIDEISTEKMTFYFASRNHYRQHLWKKKLVFRLAPSAYNQYNFFR